MHRRAKDRRVSQVDGNGTKDRTQKCSYSDRNSKCQETVLPFSKYCQERILHFHVNSDYHCLPGESLKKYT